MRKIEEILLKIKFKKFFWLDFFYPRSFPILGRHYLTRALQSSTVQISGGVGSTSVTNGEMDEEQRKSLSLILDLKRSISDQKSPVRFA